MKLLTRNIDVMAAEVAEHIAQDRVVQGEYWDPDLQRGCFIGCLGHSDDLTELNDEKLLPSITERFGLASPLLRIAENIFESLPPEQAKEFFASFPAAIGCNGRDLSLVHWQFLASELRALPSVPSEIQQVIDPVISGMDLLASGQDWPDAYAAASKASDAAIIDRPAAESEDWAAKAADEAARAASAKFSGAAAWATSAAAAAAEDYAFSRIRQRDTLLRLIAAAPIP